MSTARPHGKTHDKTHSSVHGDSTNRHPVPLGTVTPQWSNVLAPCSYPQRAEIVAGGPPGTLFSFGLAAELFADLSAGLAAGLAAAGLASEPAMGIAGICREHCRGVPWDLLLIAGLPVACSISCVNQHRS